MYGYKNYKGYKVENPLEKENFPARFLRSKEWGIFLK